MRRITLLLLLATTATCYGQSNTDIPADQAPSGSSYIDEDRPQIEQSNEETAPIEQNNEETERFEQNNAETEHFNRIRQDEEVETLRRQQQPESTFSASVQHNLGRQYKQTERSSVPRAGHVGNSKPTYHTTPAPHKRSQDSSNKNYNQQGSGVHQGPKGNTSGN